jgi:hypothetical protein
MSPEHGTIDCYDEGCRRPVCVHAQTVRAESARRVEVVTIVQAIPPTVPSIEDESNP